MAPKRERSGKARATKRRAAEAAEEPESEEEDKELASIDLDLPISRVSKVIRSDKDVNKVNRDALFAIAKSTELFVGELAKQTAAAVRKECRKIIQFKDVNDVVHEQPNAAFHFLTDELAIDTPAPDRTSRAPPAKRGADGRDT